MTWIKTSDPLALLAIEAGQTPNPSAQVGAIASNSLDVDQRSIDIGEPVPIVFARRRNDAGGILISPGATEVRFENDASNNVTAFYHLVLSEGRLDAIPVKDVLQRSCRVGSHTQTYGRRAGTWLPGNYITELVGFDKPEASYICGSIGLYPDMSTLSFEVTIPDGFDYWRRQVHVFVRGGMWVTRLLDSVLGPSDNFADLVQWMLANNGRVPTALIDTTALTEAAQFLEVNGFTCNCWLQEARNYSDLLTEWAPYFLLGESNINGKKGVRPLLPTNNDGTLKTTAITPEYTFTESEILPGTLEIDYTSWSDRQPFVAQMIWRQELGDDAAIIRTAEVQLSSNTSETGPYESHDLSAFCTSEAHAVKAGAYILARRTYVSHTVRFSTRPQVHSTILSPGSIIRVALERNATGGSLSAHDYFYQVERIFKTLAGDVNYECSHFPVDTEQRSIVSQLVAAATGTGILLTSNSSGIGCDINSATDETIPLEEYIIPDDAYDPGGLDIGTDVATNAGQPTTLDTTGLNDAGGGATPGVGGGGFAGGGFGKRSTENNPEDNLDSETTILPLSAFPTATLGAGTAIRPPVGICGDAGRSAVRWYKNDQLIVTYTFVSGVTYQYASTTFPSWVNASEGIFVIGTAEDGNVYRSETVCNDGTTVVAQGTVGSGDLSSPGWYYLFRVKLPGGSFSATEKSYGKPPWMVEYNPPTGNPPTYYMNVNRVNQAGTTVNFTSSASSSRPEIEVLGLYNSSNALIVQYTNW